MPLFIACLLMLLLVVPLTAAETVFSAPGWPTTFACDIDDPYTLAYRVDGQDREAVIAIHAIAHRHAPDHFSRLNAATRRAIVAATVDLTVDGEPHTVHLRAYQPPQVCGPLRISLEATRTWAETGQDPIENMQHAVRLSACPVGEPWGPRQLRFPLVDYRWHANSYQNTWMSLVPQGNDIYYHKGEDWGCIPDRHPVIASLGGTVVRSPLPDGDGRSNTLTIEHPVGLRINYTHMNLDQIDPGLTVGARVTVGQILGKAGATWAGKPKQSNPHLHYKYTCAYAGGWTELNTFPYAMAAYLRDTDDPAVALAGGYLFGLAGEPVTLDATRSVTRAGRSIAAARWLHADGTVQHEATVRHTWARPGTHTVVLELLLDNGQRVCDPVTVRIYDGEGGRQPGFSAWVSHHPMRGVTAGETVHVSHVKWSAPGTIVDWGDAGDGRATRSRMQHSYTGTGWHIVWLRGDDGRYSHALPVLVGDWQDSARLHDAGHRSP